MARYQLSFIELHGPLFMSGSNLGNKINAAQRGLKLVMDDERNVVWVYFKNKVSFVPTSNVASADVMDIPTEIKEALGVLEAVKTITEALPPIIAKRRGRPPLNEPEPDFTQPVPMPVFDPNDEEAAARHRAMVRAASANAHKTTATPAMINDSLIQEARNAAMGLKHSTVSKAQVQTAHQVGADTMAPKKIMSHADLAKKLEAEKLK